MVLIDYSDDGIGLQLKRKEFRGMGMQNIESRLNMISAVYEIDKERDRGFRIVITHSLAQ
jgi:signal transduction histidine kinase